MRCFHTVHNDFLIYGITQDCQLYFVEHMNYMLIKSLKVDRSNTYCYPNLVKLHLRQGIKQISLMLIIKQAMNRICTLPIEMPSLQTVSNGQLFRVRAECFELLGFIPQNVEILNLANYSIFTSLPYVACSHLRDNSFILEPDLSFMDTTFSDIIYFINAKSIGSQWDIRQFRVCFWLISNSYF
uniref:Recep_L_domain domain-containing protein n=1 Tax=Elaeophora elaphi TaxID=1147741 RepID=A0A0R3RN29_9BILA